MRYEWTIGIFYTKIVAARYEWTIGIFYTKIVSARYEWTIGIFYTKKVAARYEWTIVFLLDVFFLSVKNIQSEYPVYTTRP